MMKQMCVLRAIAGIAAVLLLSAISQAVPPPERPSTDGKYDPVNEYGDAPQTVDAAYGTLVLRWIEGEGLYFIYDGWDPPEPLVDHEQLFWTNPSPSVAQNWRFDINYDLPDEWNWHFEEFAIGWSTAANPNDYHTLNPADWDVATGYDRSPYDPDTAHDLYEAFIPQSTIPEPGTLLLLACGGLALALAKRRH